MTVSVDNIYYTLFTQDVKMAIDMPVGGEDCTEMIRLLWSPLLLL